MKTLLRSAKNEGIEIGLEKGIEKGIKIGLEKGDLQAKQAMAHKLLAKGLSIEEITDLTGLSTKELLSLFK